MRTVLLPVLLVTLTAAVLMAAFLIARALVERRRSYWRRRLNGGEEPEATPLVAEVGIERAPDTWGPRMDQAFERMIQETGSGWSPQQALGLMVLIGVTLAGVRFLWRDDLAIAAVGLLLGLSVPLGFFVVMRWRWRRLLQDQLPDVFFLLARSLRAGESVEQALETAAVYGTQPLA